MVNLIYVICRQFYLYTGGDFFSILAKVSEPIHVHAEKGYMECKFWLWIDEVEIKEAFVFNQTPAAKREIKKIIY